MGYYIPRFLDDGGMHELTYMDKSAAVGRIGGSHAE